MDTMLVTYTYYRVYANEMQENLHSGTFHNVS